MKIFTLDGQFIKEYNDGDPPDNFTGIAEYENGTKIWLLNGKYHKLNGPAAIYPFGTKEWWINGKRHRLDGPAVEWADRTKEWFIGGKRVSEFEHKVLIDIMKLKGLL